MDSQMDDDDFAALVAAAQRHSPEAWEALYRVCRPKLVTYASRRLPSIQAAEDAVSEAFLRAIDRIEDFTPTGTGFQGWMYGITRNVVRETYRATDRDRRLEDKQARTIHPAPEPSEIHDRIERAEEHETLRRAFATLSDDDQELLELRVVGQLPAEAVAGVLGKKAGAVRMAQSRALGRLRAAMKALR